MLSNYPLDNVFTSFKIIISYILINAILWTASNEIPSIKQLNGLSGTIGRVGFLLNIMLIVGLGVLGVIAAIAAGSFLLGVFVYVYAFWLYIAGVVKRTRDIGLDTSWSLTAFMPGIQFVYLLFLIFAGSGSMANDE